MHLLSNELNLLLFDLGSSKQKLPSVAVVPKLLSSWSGLPESVFLLGKDEKKKPYFLHEDSREMAISISHTGNWLCCALYKEQSIGVDIERSNRAVNLALAERYFSKEEIAYLLSASATTYCFLRLWTLKEAYGKALGIGINRAVLATSFLPILLQDLDYGSIALNNEQNYWVKYEELQNEGLILSCCSSKNPTNIVFEKC